MVQMTILKQLQPQNYGGSSKSNAEAGPVIDLARTAAMLGICADQMAIVNLYVALKSKPLAILTGPAQSGKIALVQCLAKSLVDSNCSRCQMIAGHPWWAGACDNVAAHVEVHTRFATEKMLSVIEEASQPENRQHVFIACISRISPAELLSFFTEVGFQLHHGQLMRLGCAHFSEPIPFPSNLFLIGTMDTATFDWWDNDLLSSATIIQGAQASTLSCPSPDKTASLDEREFLQSCIRNTDAAYRKITTVLKWQRQPFCSLLQIEVILRKHAVSLPNSMIDDVMIYLANSWSRLGIGLFHSSPTHNLAIALDLAIAQVLLPYAADTIRRLEIVRRQLRDILTTQFPCSAAFVTALAMQG